MTNKGPVSQFIENNFLHFNSAALVDAAKGYETHLTEGGKMMVTLAGAMSTAELGKSLAEMIRQGKVDIISCTGANLEEDIMNLVAHSHYKHLDVCKNTFIKFGKMLMIKESVTFHMNICTKYY